MAARDGAGAADRGGRKPRHAAGGDRAGLLISTAAVALMAAAFSIPTMALGSKASGGNFWPQTPPSHYQIPSDYDANVGMHPYTSGAGPCPQGHSHGCTLAPSHHTTQK
jgi:hypothetical protein